MSRIIIDNNSKIEDDKSIIALVAFLAASQEITNAICYFNMAGVRIKSTRSRGVLNFEVTDFKEEK